MTLHTGDFLNNRYRIERILGQGGMGAVYLATDESLGLQVAVKENLNASTDAERQFKREATLLATLRHPHLPRVTNHFILGDQQYLVMDFIEGSDLKEILAKAEGPLLEADVLRWGVEICSALIYLHSRTPPVIHRDIKPANIRLNADGQAILVDFGIAKASPSGQKTTTSAVALTPGFAPPEQYGMARTEPRTDQYALAATLYNLLTNQSPPDSMERLLGNTPLPGLDTLRPGLTPHLAAALQRGLELKPDDRFPNIAEFRFALEGQATPDQATISISDAATTKPVVTPNESPTTAPRPAWLIPALLSGVVVIGLIVAGLFIIPPLTTPPTNTPAPTATLTPAPTLTVAPSPMPPSATAAPPSDTPPPSDTSTPEPPTETPSLTPSPTETLPPVGGGGRIAFISNRDGPFQIYTMNVDGGEVQQLTTDDRPKWSATWQMGNLGPLTGNQIAWSPDASKLLYVAEGASGSGLDIWVVNADGTNPQNLTAPTKAGEATGDDFQPTWCNDGWIAFTSTRVGGIPQIFILRLDDRTPRNFSRTHSSPIEYGVTWFPDCKRFLLITTQNGTAELWRVFPFKQTYPALWGTFPALAEQSYRVFLSDRAGYNAAVADAVVAPSGEYVAYTRQAPDGNEIILTTVSDSQLTMNILQLTTTRSNANAHWSPDSRYLVFVAKRDGNPEIYRMNLNGGDQINLSTNPAIDLNPVWQPAPASTP